MQNHEILSALKRAIHALPHPSFEDISQVTVEKMSHHDDITHSTSAQGSPRSLGQRMRPFLIVAAVLFLGFQWYAYYRMPAVTVTVETNPAFSLTMNRQLRVLDVTPLNGDAIDLLNHNPLPPQPFEQALASLLNGLAPTNATDKKTYLISTTTRHARLSSRVHAIESQVAKKFNTQHENAVIALQFLPFDDFHTSDDLSQVGRHFLIQQLLDNDPTLSQSVLTDKPLFDLLRLSQAKHLSIDIYGDISEPTTADVEDTPLPPPDTTPTPAITPAPDLPVPTPSPQPPSIPTAQRDGDDFDDDDGFDQDADDFDDD